MIKNKFIKKKKVKIKKKPSSENEMIFVLIF